MNIYNIPVGFLGTNCYILSGDDGVCVVIDPGAQPEKIIAYLANQECKVETILLTHGHHDHIGGVKKLMEAFPEASLRIGKNDAEMLGDTKKSLALDRYSDSENFLLEKAEPVGEGDEIKLGELTIRVLETPGHTRGGVCYVCGDVIFSGDTLFYRDCGRCDLYGGDYEVLKRSLKKLAELPGDYAVYPGHGQESTLAYERNNNMYIKEAMS